MNAGPEFEHAGTRVPAARGDWSLDRELDGDRPEWGRHAALEAGGWTQVTRLWGIHLSGLSCWHASFKARGRVRSMDSVDPSASQPRDGLHPVLEVRLAHAPHYKDLIARSHPAGPAISATATAGPRWNRQTWIPSANRPWLEIRVTPVKWIPPTRLITNPVRFSLSLLRG